jgi:hypothetical protein
MKHFDVLTKAIQVLVDNGVIDTRQLTLAVQQVAKQVRATNLFEAWELDEGQDKFSLPSNACAIFTDGHRSVAHPVKKKVSYSQFVRHLDNKRVDRRIKYGIQKGHKPLWRSYRQDSRQFKRNNHTVSFEYGAE